MKRATLVLLIAGCTNGSASTDGAPPAAVDAASAPDAAMMSAPDAATPPPLVPLAVGETWQYSIDDSGGGTPPRTCTQTTQITGTADVDGRHAFTETVTIACPPNATTTAMLYVSGVADRYETRTVTGTIWYVQDPPAEGHTWSSSPDGRTPFTWHRAASQTVPAGTFSDCWTMVTTIGGSDQEFTMCRGAGEVAGSSTFSTGFAQRTVLASKSF